MRSRRESGKIRAAARRGGGDDQREDARTADLGVRRTYAFIRASSSRNRRHATISTYADEPVYWSAPWAARISCCRRTGMRWSSGTGFILGLHADRLT